MLLFFLLLLTSSRPLIRWLRWPLLILSTLAAILSWPFGSMLGYDMEQTQANGLAQNPGATWDEALENTPDWSMIVGLTWLVIAGLSCVFDWLIYRSDKKANG